MSTRTDSNPVVVVDPRRRARLSVARPLSRVFFLVASSAALHCGPPRDPSAVSPEDKAFYAQHALVENCKSDVRAALGRYCTDFTRKEWVAGRDGGERGDAQLSAETKRLAAKCESVTAVRSQLTELTACGTTFHDAVVAEAAARPERVERARSNVSAVRADAEYRALIHEDTELREKLATRVLPRARQAELEDDRHAITVKLAAVFRRYGIEFPDAVHLGLWTR